MSRPRPSFRRLAVTTLVGALAALLVAPGTGPAAATTSCGDLSSRVLHQVRPGGTGLLTLWRGEADQAVRYGFTDDRGAVFRAAAGAGAGLVGVHRLHHADTGDFVYSVEQTEIGDAVAAGYTDEGVRFHVSATARSCLTPVERWTRAGLHRMSVSTADAASLLAAGWRSEGVRFHVRPAPTTSTPPPPLTSRPIATTKGTTFSFAVVPDTQLEVTSAADGRLARRSGWVLRQKRMSFLLQTGDLVNWDTDDHAQWAHAKAGLAPLEQGELPYTVAVGNHDTQATGVGGSARDATRSHTLLRDTETLNSYLDAADFRGVGGAFEAGKVDNVYTLYTAGGLRWMVLTLEFCPRASAVAWAREAVASHPDYNVIISTHYYLSDSGGIATTNAGYGDSSPRYVWEQLVRRYPNIVMVFSGHTGLARRARVDTGLKGNKVYSFLTTMHDRTTNPTRVVTVNTKARTLSTRIYAPDDKRTWRDYSQTLKGLSLLR